VENNAATAEVATISHMVGKDDSAATKHTLCSCCTGSTGPSQLQAAARALQKAAAKNRDANHPKSAKLTVKLQAAPHVSGCVEDRGNTRCAEAETNEVDFFEGLGGGSGSDDALD